MPPRPQDNYSPVPTVSPETRSAPDYLTPQATPEAAGAGIGRALEQAGQRGEQLGTGLTDLAIRQQGMINETLATNAETDFMTRLGDRMGAYKTLEGLAAVQARPAVQTDIASLRQEIRGKLPNAMAQRAFDMMAQRHEGYALQDASLYAAQQLKAADTDSAHASMGVAISHAGSLAVAGDDKRFNDVLQDITFQGTRILGTKGWGSASGTGFNQDPMTGDVSFDETKPEGRQAKAVFDSVVGKGHALAWENRLHVLADQNVTSAYQLYEANRDKIPGEAQAKLDAYFVPKLRGAEALGLSAKTLSEADGIYSQGMSEVGKGGAATSPKGAVGQWQVMPATFQQYAKPGEKIDNPQDNETVGRRIVTDLSQRYGGDPQRIAVGYFSGPGNVAPTGSPTPWKEDHSDGNERVSAYASHVAARVQQGVPIADAIRMEESGGTAVLRPAQPGSPTGAASAAPQYVSKADFYRANYAPILEKAGADAEAMHPGDLIFAQQARARVEQQMNDVIRQQQLSYEADNHLVQQAFNGDMTKGGRPTSVEQLTATSPAVKQAWERMLVNSPQTAMEIESRILTANSKATSHDLNTYGQGFYDVFRRIHAPEGDPARITDPTQLYGMVGEGGALTIAGLEKATSEIQGRRSPDGEAESQMKTQFFHNAHQQISGRDELLHIHDPKGEELYLKFLTQALPAFDAGKKSGKTATQLLNPDSPDYIGKAIGQFRRSPAQVQKDLADAMSPAEELDLTTKEKIVDAWQKRLVTYDQAAAALARAKLIGAPTPSAPIYGVPNVGISP